MAQSRLKQGLTYDDVLLEPRYSTVVRSEVTLETRISKKLILQLPILAAAMDTVSEPRLAVALGKLGGLAVLHRNCDLETSVRMARKVKRSGVITGAAVGPHDIKRAKALDKVGVDAIFVDCAHAHNNRIIRDAKAIKKAVKAQLIVGNIATREAAQALVSFADAIKVGVGPGSICTTRVVAGIGVPQLSAVMDAVSVARKAKVPVIADGGIKYSGDIAKALAAGASAVMLGSLFAGTTEAPGSTVTIKGKKYKNYRGMGSLGAMQGGSSSDRYFQKGAKKYIPEGVEAVVSHKGPVKDIVEQMVGGLRSGMGYIGASSIPAMARQARFVQITPASLRESHPHSITISKKAPNY